MKIQTEQGLAKEIHGIQCVPGMLFSCPDEDLEKLNLQTYEIFPHEGMHVAGHIENLLEELPMQVKTSVEPQVKPKKQTSNDGRKSNSVKSKKSSRIIKVGKKILKKTNNDAGKKLSAKFRETVKFALDNKEMKCYAVLITEKLS